MDDTEESSCEDSSKPSSAIRQWKRFIHGSIAMQRMDRLRLQSRDTEAGDAMASPGSPPAPLQEGGGGLAEILEQNDAVEVEVNNGQLVIHNQNRIVLMPPRVNRDLDFLPRRTQQQIHRITHKQMVSYLQNVRDDLIKQLNSYSLVLTVLVTITFIASLQPPGSLDENGKERPSNNITGFMFFATLSFLFACIGVSTGVVGSITLFRPGFFPPFNDLADHLGSARSQNGAQVHPDRSNRHEDATVKMDNIDLLGEIVLDNLCRVRRLAVYMGCSLLTCVIAFILAGLAVIDEKNHGRYIALLVAIGIGCAALIIETTWTVSGPTFWRYKEVRGLQGLKIILSVWRMQHHSPNPNSTGFRNHIVSSSTSSRHVNGSHHPTSERSFSNA